MKCKVAFLLVCALASCTNTTSLFQENSDDWETFGTAKWQFSKGVLKGSINEGEGFLMTKKSFTNFMLELEFKPDSTINSGVFIRCVNKELSATDCHEINIWDLHPNQDFRTGAIVSKVVPKNYVETINKWNTYRIKANGNQIKVWVNNRITADSSFTTPLSGYIALQAMGNGEISFRNIKLSIIE